MVIEDYDVVKSEILKALAQTPKLWGNREIPKDIAFLIKNGTNAKPQLQEFFEDQIEFASDGFLIDLANDLGLNDKLLNSGALSQYNPGYRR